MSANSRFGDSGADDGASRGIVVGFPIEAIADTETRTTLIARAFGSFGLEPDEDDVVEETTCGCGTSSASGLPVLGVLVLRRR